MTTLAQLQVMVSRDLRDTSNLTFSLAEVTDLINAGIAEVSRLAPRQFQEDVAMVANQQEYELAEGTDARIRPVVVEVWTDATPPKFRARIPSVAEAVENTTNAGWRYWAGVLTIPEAFATTYDSNYDLRVWGYAPFAALVNSGDTTDLDTDRTEAVREFCAAQGFGRLVAERVLFDQWQGLSKNTDLSPAGALSIAMSWDARWNRRRKQLGIIRELS